MKARRRFPILIDILLAHFKTHGELPLGPHGAVARDAALFLPEGLDPEELPPSPSLVRPPVLTGPLPADWAPWPRFSIEKGRFCAAVPVEPGTDLYGTGEVVGPLRRNGTTVILWNSGYPGYSWDGGRRLYQSHPWVLAVRPDGSAFGVIFDTCWKAVLVCGDEIRCTTQGPGIPVIVIRGTSPSAVLRTLGDLTGRMELPPLWALGYHQSRYTYVPATRVRDVAREFRERGIPCDAIWLDIDFMDGFRVFTFNPQTFPDPPGLAADLLRQGFRLVATVNPGVRVDPGYSVYDSGTRSRVWVSTREGHVFKGKVWASSCVFPDFTSPRVRAWWAGLQPLLLDQGVAGLWNDMNEPSIFDGPDLTMPETVHHAGGGGLQPGQHLQYHNLYGMLMVRATRDGMLAARPDRRPFILTRANFLGGQRYAATWTGDNYSTHGDFRLATPMSLTLGLSGQPFSGPDVGGFVGDPTPSLWARWMATGVFYPFCRGHSDKGTRKKEPWAFGPAVERTARIALLRRYRLLPYLYTCFQEAASTGLPVMRPLFLADPADPALRTEERSFMVGGDLLVVPRGGRQGPRPKGTWLPLFLVEGDRRDPFQACLYVRGGAILPLGPEVLHTGEAPEGATSLVVAPGPGGLATGRLYHDAGDGFGYRNGDFRLVTYQAELREEEVLLRISGLQGWRPRPPGMVKVERLLPSGQLSPAGEGPY